MDLLSFLLLIAMLLVAMPFMFACYDIDLLWMVPIVGVVVGVPMLGASMLFDYLTWKAGKEQ